MKWDKKDRRYEDDNGRPVSPAEVRKHVDEYISHEKKDVERKAEKLFVGALTVSAFFEYLRQKVTAWHSVTGTMAYGGESQMDGKRWARVNETILSELTYLNEFETAVQASFTAAENIAGQTVAHLAKDIPAGLESLVEERVTEALLRAAPSEAEAVIQATVREVLADSVGTEAASAVAEAVRIDKASAILDDLIGGTIPNRSKMYTDASYSTYENNVAARETDAGALARRVCEEDEASCDDCVQAATDDFMSLAEVSDIGSLQCLNNCRCFYEFSYEGVEPIRIDGTVNEIFARP